MTKKFFLILLGVMTLCSSICSAKIPANRFFLGGLTVGSKMSDAIKIYGFPTKTVPAGDTIHSVYDHWFGNGSLIISEGANGDIQSIFVTANNGWTTPAGIAVGMNSNVALKLYGQPDELHSRVGKNIYIYHGEINYLFGNGIMEMADAALYVVFNKNDSRTVELALIAINGERGHSDRHQPKDFIDEILKML